MPKRSSLSPDHGRGGKRRKHSSADDSSSSCVVFVGNLDWRTRWFDLKDHMRKAGNVDSADVLIDNRTKRSKGCGIVKYQNARDAARAIRELNESQLDGRTIFVQPDSSSRGTDKKSDSVTTTKTATTANNSLYVGNLSFDCTWQHLKDLFKRYGRVEHAEIPEKNGRPRGYGLVRFLNSKDAQVALNRVNEMDFQGRTLFVKWDGNNAPDPPGLKGEPEASVYVGNLSFDCSKNDLVKVFQAYGRVEHATIVENPVTKRSKGYGLVQFLSSSEAKRAIDKADGMSFQGRNIRVKWDKKEQRENESRDEKSNAPTIAPKKEKKEPPPAPSLDGALSCPR